MIQVLIVDDEAHCIDRLQTLLLPAHGGVLEIGGTARGYQEAIEKITSHKPDLVFLDVQINERTGFDLLRALPEINFAVIFVTAYEQFAIQAIKFSAIDYLLKPVDPGELNVALLKFLNGHSQKTTAQKIDILLQNTQNRSDIPKKIVVPTAAGLELIDVADIVRCQSDVNYTTLYLRDKQKRVVARTLKEFEEMLSVHAFFRVHNSHLINLAYIKSYNKGKGGSVKLMDGVEVEVSSRRKDDFIKRLAEL